MRPSQVAAALRQIANEIDKSKQPNRLMVASDIQSIIVRMAADPISSSVTIPYSVRSDVDNKMMEHVRSLDPDGSLAAELQRLLADVGGSIPDWQDTGFDIECDASSKDACEKLIWSIRNEGTPGSEELVELLRYYEPV